MASTITNFSSVIDAQFPVPGQDNDTQGFRNNFGYIRDSLGAAAAEITDLQVEQLGIISQINSITTPENIVATTVLASAVTATTVKASGTITAGAFAGDGSQLTNISVGNSFSNLNVSGTLKTGNTNVIGQLTASNIVAQGTIQAAQFVGDGSLLTNLPPATLIDVANITLGGDIAASNASISGKVTAGSFVGNGSQLTGLVFPEIGPKIVVTESGVFNTSATINKLFAKDVTIEQSLFVTGNAIFTGSVVGTFIGDGSQLKGVQIDRQSIFEHSVIDTASYEIDYRDGQFQTVTVDTTDRSGTDFKITNWPTSGLGTIQVQVKLTGTPLTSPVIASTATTYNVSSTNVTVAGRAVDGKLIGTLGLRRGFGIWTTSDITLSPIGVITEVNSPTRITVETPYLFGSTNSFVTYYFAPNPNDRVTYNLGLVADTGQTVKPSLQAMFASIAADLYNTVVLEAYSPDGGTTIYVKNIYLYDYDENSIA